MKKLQLEHEMQRLQNVTEYKVIKSKKARACRKYRNKERDVMIKEEFSSRENGRNQVEDIVINIQIHLESEKHYIVGD